MRHAVIGAQVLHKFVEYLQHRRLGLAACAARRHDDYGVGRVGVEQADVLAGAGRCDQAVKLRTCASACQLGTNGADVNPD